MEQAWWENTETWTTRKGETIKLEDLDPTHRRNIIAMLRREAKHLRWQIADRALLDAAFHDGGDAAQDALDRIADDATWSPAVEVIDGTPLMRRLLELEQGEQSPESKAEVDPIAAAWKALDRYETETDPNGYDGTPDDVVDEMALALRKLAERAAAEPLHPHVSRETVRHERRLPPFEPSARAYPDEHSELL